MALLADLADNPGHLRDGQLVEGADELDALCQEFAEVELELVAIEGGPAEEAPALLARVQLAAGEREGETVGAGVGDVLAATEQIEVWLCAWLPALLLAPLGVALAWRTILGRR